MISLPGLNPISAEKPGNGDLHKDLFIWLMNLPLPRKGNTWYDLCGRYDGALTSMSPGEDWTPHPAGKKSGWGALRTDGTDQYVDLGTVKHDIGTGQFTWAIWYYALSTTGESSGHNGLIAHGSAKPSFYWRRGGGENLAAWWGGFRDFGCSVSLGEWHHLVLRRKGGFLNGFIDGVKCPTSHGSAENMTNEQLLIGRSTTGVGPSNSDGYWDDFRFWRRALQDSEVIQAYHDSMRGYQSTLRRANLLWLNEVAAGGSSTPYYYNWRRRVA